MGRMGKRNGQVLIVRVVSHRRAAYWHKRGWQLMPLLDAKGRLSHHAAYCCLAVKRKARA